MKFIKKPAFITGILAAILVFAGVGMKTARGTTDGSLVSDGNNAGDYILYTGIALAGIFWIWSIASVVGASDMKPFQKRFWLISVIAVPVVGALVFHILHQESGKITT